MIAAMPIDGAARMRTLFQNPASATPKVSLILLDWNCRESFHALDYLAAQDVPRADYEIIWIEYYDRRVAEIDRRLEAAAKAGKPPPLDLWIVLGMGADLYYHKHLMYNVGIARARGEIVVICDSDAMFEPSFIRTISESFAADPGIVLHIDQVRNIRRDFYPFNYPSFAEMRGDGAANWLGDRTTGVADSIDPLHTRNYGACMCAWRADLIAIGGADESLDYVGHVCGPYELTFRLANFGRRETWHDSHFIYHAWHPGTDGDFNYIGPNDGRNMSSTALAVKRSRRILPLKENEAIRLERSGAEPDAARRLAHVIDPAYPGSLTKEAVARSPSFTLFKRDHGPPKLVGEAGECDLMAVGTAIYAVPRYLAVDNLFAAPSLLDPRIRRFASVSDAIAAVTAEERFARDLFGPAAAMEVVEWDGRWVAMPRAHPPIDPSDPGWLAAPDVLWAESKQGLATKAAAPRGDVPPPASARTEEDVEVTVRLDRIAAELKELRRRVDRVNEIAERSQHQVGLVHQRLVHLEVQMAGIANNRIARFLRGLGLFRLLRALGLWGKAG